MLLAKVLFTPVCMCAATLFARRFGPAAGGIFTALPLLSGPISFFLYLEQGRDFAIHALHSAMFGYMAIVCCIPFFLLAAARTRKWAFPVLAGTGAYVFFAWLLNGFQGGATRDMLLCLGALGAGFLLMPHPQNPRGFYIPRWWDLPLRMVTAAVIVLGVTGLAEILGPAWSGYVSTYPSMSFLMATFTFAQSGYPAAVFYWRGLIAGLSGSVLFFYTVIITLPFLPAWLAYTLAVFINLLANGFLFWIAIRTAKRPG